jgi:hypothetical protein
VSNAASGKERKAEMAGSKPPEDREWYERTRYQILLFVVGIALFDLLLGLILDWYIAPDTSTQKKDLVQALGLITAGVAGAVGIFFTWRGQERNQRNTQEELRLTRQGQITERFTRAIDQLGSKNVEIRLGGIYALERIARESEEDHWPIMEVLTAYVRQHARLPPERGSPEDTENTAEAKPPESKEDVAVAEDPKQNSKGKSAPSEVSLPKPDIQAIMTVIGHRTRPEAERRARPEAGTPDRLDFYMANLFLASLSNADFARANFSRANLSHAFLMKTNLAEAVFRVTDLGGAWLIEADLERANLERANLKGADLAGANLKGANLKGANLEGADLVAAKLWGADLTQANLTGVKRITAEDLYYSAETLEGATMPDGQGYQEWLDNWLKNDLKNEDSEKDGENDDPS